MPRTANCTPGEKFWNTDIDEIERKFLKGRSINSLPVYLTDAVPPQGSVLLDRIVDVDKEVPRFGLLRRIFYYIFRPQL